MLNVRELIATLQKLDPELVVVAPAYRDFSGPSSAIGLQPVFVRTGAIGSLHRHHQCTGHALAGNGQWVSSGQHAQVNQRHPGGTFFEKYGCCAVAAWQPSHSSPGLRQHTCRAGDTAQSPGQGFALSGWVSRLFQSAIPACEV